MNKEEFERWYRDNIETMATLGVFHPDSPYGRTVHLAVASIQPQLDEIMNRLSSIEKKLEIDYVPPKKEVKVKKKPIVVEEKKPVVVEINKDNKPIKKSEWQVGRKG